MIGTLSKDKRVGLLTVLVEIFSCLTYSIILFSQTNLWLLDSSLLSLFLVSLVGDGAVVFISLSRYLCMSAPYLNLRPMYSATSFINTEYSSVFDPPEQSNMNPFRSSRRPSDFIVWECIAVPGRSLQDVFVVG